MKAIGRVKVNWAFCGADVGSINGHLSVPGREWRAAFGKNKKRPLGEENCFSIARRVLLPDREGSQIHLHDQPFSQEIANRRKQPFGAAITTLIFSRAVLPDAVSAAFPLLTTAILETCQRCAEGAVEVLELVWAIAADRKRRYRFGLGRFRVDGLICYPS